MSAKNTIRRQAEANVDAERATPRASSVRPEPIFKPRPVGNIFKRDLEDARRRQREERTLGGHERSMHTAHMLWKQAPRKPAPAPPKRIKYKTAESALSTESQTFLAGSGEGLGILRERWDRLDELEAEVRAMGDLELRGEVKQGALVECRR